MQSKTTTNTLSPRNTKPSFSTCPRSIFQTSKAGLLADCVEQCSCGCAFSSFRSMTSASASQNTVMAVAPDSNRLPFSPGRVLRAPCMRIELWPYYNATVCLRQLTIMQLSCFVRSAERSEAKNSPPENYICRKQNDLPPAFLFTSHRH